MVVENVLVIDLNLKMWDLNFYECRRWFFGILDWLDIYVGCVIVRGLLEIYVKCVRFVLNNVDFFLILSFVKFVYWILIIV